MQKEKIRNQAAISQEDVCSDYSPKEYVQRKSLTQLHVIRDNPPIDKDTRVLISRRYKRITKAVNEEFWDSSSEISHSRYVGSYGRGTAINTSDLDVLIELPREEYNHFASLYGNGQSRLLQAVKEAIHDTYPNMDIKGDGQVVVVKFSDDMKFEILSAFQNLNMWGEWE